MAGPWTKEWWKRQEEASKKRSGAVGAWDRDKAKHDAKAKADAEAESRARAEAVGFEWEPRNPNAEARAAADARYRAAADARVRAVADARVRAEAEADAQARAEAERKAKEEARVRSWEEAAGAGARARADEEAEARADAEAATVLGLQPDEDDEDTEIHTKKKKEPDPLFGVDRYAVPDSTATPPVGQDELDPGLDVGRVTPPDRPPTPRVDQDEVDEALLLGQYTSPDRTPTPRVDQDEVDPGLDVGRVTPLGVKDEPVLPVAQPTAPVLPMAQSTALVLQMAQPTTSVVPTAVPHEEIPLQAFLDAGTVFLNNQPTDVKSLIRPRKVHAPYVYGSMEEYEAEKEKTKQEAKWAAQTYLNARMRDGSLSFLELPPQSQISKEDLGDKFLIDGVPTNTKAYFDARFEDYLRKNRLSDNPRWVSDEGVKVLRDKNDAIAMLDVNEARQDGRVRLLGESWVPDAPDIYLRHEQGHVNPLEFSSVYTAIQSKLDARDRGGPGGVLITGPEDERIDEAAELVPLDMLVGPGGTWFRQGVQTAKRTRRYVAGLRGTRGLTPTQDVIASTLKTTPFKDILRAEQIQARRAAFAHESDFMQPPVPSQRRYVDITIDGQKQRIDMGPERLQHIYRDPLDPDQAIYLKQPPRGQITTRPNVASAPREGFLDRRVVDAIKMQEVIDPATQIQRSLSVASAPKRGFLGRLLRRRAVDPSDPTGQSEAIIKIGDKTYMVHPDQRPALRGMIPLLEGFPTSREGSIARIIRIHRTYRGARRVKTPGGKPGQWTIEEFTQPGYVEMEIDGKVHRFLRDPLDVRLPGKGTYAIEKPPSDIQDFTMDWSQWRGQGGPGTKPSSGPTVADEITELHAPTSASSPKLITSETPGKGTELWLPASGVDVALDAGRAQLHTPSVRSIETQAEPGIWPMSPETVPANTGAQTDVTTDVDEALLLGQYTPAEGTGVKTDTEPRPYVIPHFTGPETVPTTPVKTDTEPRPYVIPHFTGPETVPTTPVKTDTEPRPYVIPHFTGPETVPEHPVKTDTEPTPYVIPHFTGPETVPEDPVKTATEPTPYVIPPFTGPETLPVEPEKDPYVIPHFTGPETVPTTPVKTDTEPTPYVIPHFTAPETVPEPPNEVRTKPPTPTPPTPKPTPKAPRRPRRRLRPPIPSLEVTTPPVRPGLYPAKVQWVGRTLHTLDTSGPDAGTLESTPITNENTQTFRVVKYTGQVPPEDTHLANHLEVNVQGQKVSARQVKHRRRQTKSQRPRYRNPQISYGDL